MDIYCIDFIHVRGELFEHIIKGGDVSTENSRIFLRVIETP